MRQHLTSARLLGTSALTIFGIFAVDMPDGYLGRVDAVTLFGKIYIAALLFLTLICVVGRLREKAWVNLIVPVIWSANMGVFVPAVAFNPLLSVLLILWHLVTLGRYLFPIGSGFAPSDTLLGEDEEPAIARWHRYYGRATGHLLIVSIILTIAVVGFELSQSLWVLLVCFALHLGALVGTIRFGVLLFLKRSRWAGLLAILPMVAMLSAAGFGVFGFSLAMLALYEFVVLGLLMARGPIFTDLIKAFFDYPAILIVSTFATIILLGALFLSFPQSSANGASIAAIDALFTATSAVCVTGLIVLDTATDFSTFGHIVILALIQIGGLGIMVLSTFGTLLIGGKLGLRGERALGEMLDLSDPRAAYRLTRFIVVSTLSIEAVGAACLSYSFWRHGLAPQDAVWHGVFHAVSAFCNAGFALQSDSLILFQNAPFPLMVVATLIVFGSFGFPVLAGGWQWLGHRVRIWRKLENSRHIRISVQSKIAIVMTVGLLVLGTLLFVALEWNNSLAGMGVADHIFNAIFQSATLRTAGFNSVDFTQLHTASLLFMLAMMFIGASPGGTGGGIKTTTFAVLLASVRAITKGRPRIILFDRRIAHDIVYRSIAITLATAAVVGVAVFLLLLIEPMSFDAILFEVTSAVATVGLSVGITPQLSSAGRFIIIFVMFTGRIGPLTLALLIGNKKPDPVEYPSERIMVG